MVEQGPLANPNEGRTIVHRAYNKEIVLSSSYEVDTFDEIVKVLERILGKEVEGGEVSYVQ